MSKKQQAAVAMVAALAAQAYLGKVAKQQGAALGLPVMAVSLIGYAIGPLSDGDTSPRPLPHAEGPPRSAAAAVGR
ncbi:hypothetical protein [Streptomyces bungoensis]|uniref:hypothetical protein n=1 Tax=Streptomyces bungoensis TaxID=285568 RepID=UPI0034497A50